MPIHVITLAVCEKHELARGCVLFVCVVCSHKDRNGTLQSRDNHSINPLLLRATSST